MTSWPLSGDYGIVLPLALCTAVATAASRAMRQESLYMQELSRRGVGWELTLEGRALKDQRRRGPRLVSAGRVVPVHRPR